MTAQLALFDQPAPQAVWTVRDIWSPAWNQAINLAIIEACTGKWVTMDGLAKVAAQFGLATENPPFSYQVHHLGNERRLKVRANPKTKITEWMSP